MLTLRQPVLGPAVYCRVRGELVREAMSPVPLPDIPLSHMIVIAGEPAIAHLTDVKYHLW